MNRFVGGGKTPTTFEVSVDVIAEDSTIIQICDYRTCSIQDYTVFVNSDKEEYRFLDIDDLEIRELFVIGCQGFIIK